MITSTPKQILRTTSHNIRTLHGILNTKTRHRRSSYLLTNTRNITNPINTALTKQRFTSLGPERIRLHKIINTIFLTICSHPSLTNSSRRKWRWTIKTNLTRSLILSPNNRRPHHITKRLPITGQTSRISLCQNLRRLQRTRHTIHGKRCRLNLVFYSLTMHRIIHAKTITNTLLLTLLNIRMLHRIITMIHTLIRGLRFVFNRLSLRRIVTTPMLPACCPMLRLNLW